MELQTVSNIEPQGIKAFEELQSSSKPFIEANTIPSTLEEIRNNHIIPVFIKDNEPLISHTDFIESALRAAEESYGTENIMQPNIRLSHPIKGRVPSAKNKPANELTETEKTIYYERMAFVIDIPSIEDEIDGNRLCLSLGGVKTYNQDNLYKKGADEHFKFFIGFKNTICTNLCVWSDGFSGSITAHSQSQLYALILQLIKEYNTPAHLFHLRRLAEHSITEHQFALMIGRLRMYPYLPRLVQNKIQPLLLGDTQINTVVRDYYRDNSFCRSDQGDINLWRLFNLLTGANKSSYIDYFLERSVSSFNFCERVRWALQNKHENWFLN